MVQDIIEEKGRHLWIDENPIEEYISINIINEDKDAWIFLSKDEAIDFYLGLTRALRNKDIQSRGDQNEKL